ncbi:DUF4870 domain-containing protein [Desmospora profundinema]|uniref:Tic20 family protein n=1 Tax=Desmospora profundinema TaxID=1571184 RepID=A0ABU1IIW3_9BACL|nr:DUF4870 domain-containing protein [Desmospora profundinema]MDR6224698.1 putative Tic20 family protein [Desmospora profundinema]
MEQTPIPEQARTWGMLTHLLSLSCFIVPFGNFAGPLIIWLLKKEEHDFIDDQGKESLNFQISFFLYAIGLTIVLGVIGLIGLFLLELFLILFMGLGFFLGVAISIYWIVIVIIASIRANSGQFYRYPLTIRFIK